MTAESLVQTLESIAPAHDKTNVLPRRIGLAGLVLCIAGFWMIQHPYEGIVHDSILYSLSALARLHPESLSHDVFLSVGAQDRFTLFGPIAAALARLLGLERGAALLTLFAHAAFFVCGWLLARRIMPSGLALLSVALLVTLPSTYGAKHVFSYAEPFMTPRLPAEALVLATLAAALGRRYVLAGVCLLAAGLLHPLMAAAGAMLLFVLYIGLPRPRLGLSLAIGGFLALLLVAWVAPFGPVSRFSDGWFNLMYTRGTYLFPTRWPLEDYLHACVPLAVLTITAITASKGLVRSVSIAAIVIGLAGLVITIIGADLLRVVLIAQLQPWRWLWLTNTLAAVLTPVAVQALWRGGNPGRAAAILVAASWVCIDENFAPGVAALAIAAAATAHLITDPGRGRLLLFGACFVLVMSLAVFVGFVQGVHKALSGVPADTLLYTSNYLLALRQWKPWASGGVVAACVFLLAWWALEHRANLTSAVGGLVLGIVLCAAFAPLGWNAWTRIDYPDSQRAQFAEWRQQIPATAQVLWLGSPWPTWYLLERASYWSSSQMAASVYSENMAREFARRERILQEQEVTSDKAHDLIGICRNNPSLGFFATTFDMGPSPFAPVDLVGAHEGRIRLYRCADYRG